MPAASIRNRARRAIMTLRSAALAPLSSIESRAMLSWRGGWKPAIGRDVSLMASLLDDGRVVWKASPESKVRQTAVEIGEGLGRNVRRPDLHRCADRGVQHPCRYDERRPGLCLNQRDVCASALLCV